MSSAQINRVLQIQEDPYALLSQEWLVTNGLGGTRQGPFPARSPGATMGS